MNGKLLERAKKYSEEFIDNYPLKNWSYEEGCALSGASYIYKLTEEQKYFDFIFNFLDKKISKDGEIEGYDIEKYNVDMIKAGTSLFFLYDQTSDEKYRKAMDVLYRQIENQPRTESGNFWHKKRYPYQIWMDGLFMAMPFYTEYEKRYNEGKYLNDICNQYVNAKKYLYSNETKLYSHAIDTSKSMYWCREDGTSKEYWLRAIGWHLMSLVDVLENYPEEMKENKILRNMLQEAVEGVMKYQDQEKKMWYQIIDSKREENYLETSGTLMISYALLKGSRLGFLDSYYRKKGEEVFEATCREYLVDKKDGRMALGGICQVAGLGDNNGKRRDGSFEYYMSEAVVEDDPKASGIFLMCYSELIKK